jgi:hypothetical protein
MSKERKAKKSFGVQERPRTGNAKERRKHNRAKARGETEKEPWFSRQQRWGLEAQAPAGQKEERK